MSLRAFGFHQLSPSSYHIPKSKSSLILFFPWLNAAPRHLLKYASLHRDLYPDASTLLFTTSANDFLTRAEFHDSVFNIIPQHERIFVHTMSNGGCYSLTGLALAYKSRTLTKLPTSSMLVDSAPGGSDFPGAYMRAYNALTMDIPHDFTRWPKMLGIGAMAFPRLLLRKMLGMENRLDWIRRDMNDAAIMTQGTRAYVYSMEDAVIDWKAVTAHAQDAKGKGWDVKEVLFEGAHVGHYRQDPERYRGVMKSIY